MSESEQQVKRGRGRPPLTEEQKQARDEKKAKKQHEYYLLHRDKINDKQKAVKAEKYKQDPAFRQRAIEYITAYNKRKSAITRFAEEWQDPAFQAALKEYLIPYPHPNTTD